ncbi:MAG TPA: hypothetical protein VGQ14_04085 [Candidatus Eisenbacteria bacterium]|nr:hypothetical protein [Candidatus Eisenbacteria bacterium]
MSWAANQVMGRFAAFRTTTLIRALFGRLVPPSLFGHIRKYGIAACPSVGEDTGPA